MAKGHCASCHAAGRANAFPDLVTADLITMGFSKEPLAKLRLGLH
jgi:mono/diheme cytochrome c family protein